MKIFLTLLISVFISSSCKTSKDYLSRSDNDNSLFDAIKALKKNGNDTAAINALPILYGVAQQRHMRKINSLSVSEELSRYDKLIEEYNTLQHMHDAIIETDAAAALVSPLNYLQTIYELKQQAAEEYYVQGNSFLDKTGRDNTRKAYQYFKSSDDWVPGYKDANEKMKQAYEAAIVIVVINPIIDNSFFSNSSWGNYGYNFSNEYFQQTLVRELGGKNSSRYAAKFYTDWEARRDNAQPDLVVDLVLKNIQIYPNSPYNYSRYASRQVEQGRDSSGRVTYETISATVSITRQTYSGFAELEVNITDFITKANISRNTFRENYIRQEEYASYTGDSRALSANDWALINNNNFKEPAKGEILSDIYRKIYPQVKNRIIYAVDW